jgi:hypothetical protein
MTWANRDWSIERRASTSIRLRTLSALRAFSTFRQLADWVRMALMMISRSLSAGHQSWGP